MIAWSIAAAQDCGFFDHIMVSTDDDEIADMALKSGAEVPFIRPSELADDFASTTPVVAHAVRWYFDQGQHIAAACCLYATAPFVEPTDIKKGLDLLTQAPVDRFVFTATSYASPIQRALRFDPASGKANMFNPEEFTKRSQDLEPAYHDAGQFYWGRPLAWLNGGNLFEGSKPLLLPRWRVQDIDTPEDWIMAELMKQALAHEVHNEYK